MFALLELLLEDRARQRCVECFGASKKLKAWGLDDWNLCGDSRARSKGQDHRASGATLKIRTCFGLEKGSCGVEPEDAQAFRGSNPLPRTILDSQWGVGGVTLWGHRVTRASSTNFLVLSVN